MHALAPTEFGILADIVGLLVMGARHGVLAGDMWGVEVTVVMVVAGTGGGLRRLWWWCIEKRRGDIFRTETEERHNTGKTRR
jgi:hypothetical protein